MTTKRKIIWTIGNVLVLSGMILLLFVGGLFADEQYNVYAASGDNNYVAPVVAPPAATPSQAAHVPAAAVAPTTTQPQAPSRFQIPVLNNGSGTELNNAVPSQTGTSGPSTITRIVIPAIKVDRKVVEVGWTIQQIGGQDVAIWNVDKYRVGHNQGSSNPGGGGNIVLAGHSGGNAYPFNDIFYLKKGDLIELTSNGQVYQYAVSDHILVDEVGQPLEKRLENARYIEPTNEEVITMVACWPLTGPDKFKQRIIIRAKPIRAANPAPQTTQSNQEQSGWTAR